MPQSLARLYGLDRPIDAMDSAPPHTDRARERDATFREKGPAATGLDADAFVAVML